MRTKLIVLTFSLTLAFASNARRVSSQRKVKKIKLTTNIIAKFAANKRIWGSFSALKYQISAKGKGYRTRRVTTTPQSGLVMNKGKFTFIDPINLSGNTKFITNSFPFYRIRKSYRLKTGDHNDHLFALFKDQIYKIARKFPGKTHRINASSVKFTKFICRWGKHLVKCHISADLIVKKS